jgi:hypothetical protein
LFFYSTTHLSIFLAALEKLTPIFTSRRLSAANGQNLFHFSKSFLQGSRPSLSAQRLKISIEQALGGHKHQLLTSYYHIVIILLTDKTPEIQGHLQKPVLNLCH